MTLAELVSGPSLVHFSTLGCANCDNQLQQLAIAAVQLHGTAEVVVVTDPTPTGLAGLDARLSQHGSPIVCW